MGLPAVRVCGSAFIQHYTHLLSWRRSFPVLLLSLSYAIFAAPASWPHIVRYYAILDASYWSSSLASNQLHLRWKSSLAPNLSSFAPRIMHSFTHLRNHPPGSFTTSFISSTSTVKRSNSLTSVALICHTTIKALHGLHNLTLNFFRQEKIEPHFELFIATNPSPCLLPHHIIQQ